MGFKEFIENLGKGNKERKEMFREAEEQMRIQEMLENRKKSANERELERFMKEEREEQIKEQLEFYRRKRRDEINFAHNPLDAPNITSKTEWNVMKERNQFKGNQNMFSNQQNVIKDNPNLLKNNRSLCGI